MNFSNEQFKLGYLYGFMDAFRMEDFGNIVFDEWIEKLNYEFDNLDIRNINDDLIHSLMGLFCGDIDTEEINGIKYLLIGCCDDDDVDEYDGLLGIVFMEDERLKIISLEDFIKLKNEDSDEEEFEVDIEFE